MVVRIKLDNCLPPCSECGALPVLTGRRPRLDGSKWSLLIVRCNTEGCTYNLPWGYSPVEWANLHKQQEANDVEHIKLTQC